MKWGGGALFFVGAGRKVFFAYLFGSVVSLLWSGHFRWVFFFGLVWV